MSETARSSTNTIVIALVVVVVVLAAVLGYSIWKNNNAVPAVSDVAAGSATGAGAAAGTGAGAGTGATTGGTTGGTTGAPAAFDAKTATKVPAGTTPLEFVKAYHEEVMQQKYEDAYNKLPLDKKQSYGDAASYGSQVAAYGITSYEIGAPTESGDTWTVAATQVTPQMPITYTWTLKKVGGQWYVVSRAMGGQ